MPGARWPGCVDQGFERIGILGTSLGSCLSMLTAAHEPHIRAQALNHVSPWFADVVWRGLSTRHVREGLEGTSTWNTTPTCGGRSARGRYLDRVATTKHAAGLRQVRPDVSRRPVGDPVDEFHRRGLPHEVAVLPCGHYSTGSAPFKFIDGYVLTKFLRSRL